MISGGKNPLRITVDTREQTPLPFPEELVEITRATVPIFDYALTGDEAHFAVERKSAQDFLSSLIVTDNFNRELAKIWKAKAQRFGLICYVVECQFDHVMDERAYRVFSSGKVHAGFVLRQWRRLIHDEGVVIHFAGTRELAARSIMALLKQRRDYLENQ